jgi:hypothetical protein
MRTSYWLSPTCRAIIEFLVKEGNSTRFIYERLCGVYGDGCMGARSVRRWVKHLRTERRTSPISRAVAENCRNWTQQIKSRRAHQTRQKDNSQRNCSAAWSGAPRDPGDDGDCGISKNLFPLGSPFGYGCRGKQNGWELLSHSTYIPDLTPSDYHLFGSLKYHLRGYTTRLTWQSRKPCEAGCEDLERTFAAQTVQNSATLAEMHKSGWIFCRKVKKDAYFYWQHLVLYVYLPFIIGQMCSLISVRRSSYVIWHSKFSWRWKFKSWSSGCDTV